MKFREVEFKYRADDITLDSFRDFCKSRQPTNYIEAAGFDYFYYNQKDPDAFYRHRVGPDQNQLTFKRKTQDKNNFIRVERNISMSMKTKPEDIEGLVAESGYKFNRKIFKSCFVYYFEWYVLSYYICYDSNFKEMGRFVEIEANEDHDWGNEQRAWDAIIAMEKICKPSLGLSPQARIKKSLFELFRVA